MKIFLFGATSMAGYSLWLHAKEPPLTPFCSQFVKAPQCKDWRRINLEDESAYEALFSNETPTHIIHCGGICDVDMAEKDPAWARQINVGGVRRFLRRCPEGVRLVYVSSDHVFSGDQKVYSESTPTDPLTVYGQSRVEAEQLVLNRPNSLVLRFGLAIGPSYNGKTGHLNWLQHRTKKNLKTTVVSDEIRSVVWGEDLAERILAYTRSAVVGLRHITATEPASRPQLADYLSKKYKIPSKIHIESRKDRAVAHLGHIELKTIYKDALARPLEGVAASRKESA